MLEIHVACFGKKYAALNCSVFYTLVKYKLPEDGGHNLIPHRVFYIIRYERPDFELRASTSFGDVRMPARLCGMQS